jgi:hypothetical protein
MLVGGGVKSSAQGEPHTVRRHRLMLCPENLCHVAKIIGLCKWHMAGWPAEWTLVLLGTK